MAEGIVKRHGRRCASRDGGKCNCEPAYQAWVFSKRDNKKIKKSFRSAAEARGWRSDALSALRSGAMRATRPITVKAAWEAWYEAAKSGAIRNRSGDPFKPSAIRSYERAMRLRVLPALGSMRLADVRRPDLQDLADRLLAEGLNPSTIGVSLLPLRAIYRRAIARGELAVNPTTGLELPAVRGRRERFASPAEAEALIAAVPVEDRPIWATAMYAGLRRGELMALRCGDVDLATGLLHVRHGWDDCEGEIELKSSAGKRKVPIAAVLRDHLTDHRLRTECTEGLFFGRTAADPFEPKALTKAADAAWRAAKLDRITLHEARHTFASLMIAAGVNAKALSVYMGHANIKVTLDTYGHLMPGSEDEAAALLDAYMDAQREAAEAKAREAGPTTGPQLAQTA